MKFIYLFCLLFTFSAAELITVEGIGQTKEDALENSLLNAMSEYQNKILSNQNLLCYTDHIKINKESYDSTFILIHNITKTIYSYKLTVVYDIKPSNQFYLNELNKICSESVIEEQRISRWNHLKYIFQNINYGFGAQALSAYGVHAFATIDKKFYITQSLDVNTPNLSENEEAANLNLDSSTTLSTGFEYVLGPNSGEFGFLFGIDIIEIYKTDNVNYDKAFFAIKVGFYVEKDEYQYGIYLKSLNDEISYQSKEYGDGTVSTQQTVFFLRKFL